MYLGPTVLIGITLCVLSACGGVLPLVTQGGEQQVGEAPPPPKPGPFKGRVFTQQEASQEFLSVRYLSYPAARALE